MVDRPRIENAPGLVLRPRRDGWVAEWHARSDLVRRGFRPPTVPLWRGTEPSEQERAHVSDQCGRLQSEMLVWGRGGIPQVAAFDGTLTSLIRAYQSDTDSSYRKLRYRTRISYDSNLRRIDKDHGAEPVESIKARTLLRYHEDWTKSGVSMAHTLIRMLGTLCTFGATILEDAECERVCGMLHRMRFRMAKPRQERITAEQAIAIRQAAHALGLPSLALAQAFQFECTLRQKDVIGEYVPLSEPGTSDITAGGEKWLRGIRWSEIDQNLVLKHTTSKRRKDVEVNLRLAPMVMEELARLSTLPTVGPVIVCERTALPYTAHQFRYYWRLAARAAGVPDHVFNMDSRAGAITEGLDATGGDLDAVRIAATHSNVQTTQGYSRGNAERTANVMKLRIEHRNKSGK